MLLWEDFPKIAANTAETLNLIGSPIHPPIKALHSFNQNTIQTCSPDSYPANNLSFPGKRL